MMLPTTMSLCVDVVLIVSFYSHILFGIYVKEVDFGVVCTVFSIIK